MAANDAIPATNAKGAPVGNRHAAVYRHAGARRLSAEPGGNLLCFRTMHSSEVPFRNQQVRYGQFGQLVDQPIHGPGYFPPVERPQPQFRGHFRNVQLLLSGLFQPLRPTIPGRVSFRVSGVDHRRLMITARIVG